MKKRLCKFVCIVAALTIVFSAVIPVSASSLELDLSIDREVSQSSAVRSALFNYETKENPATDMKEIAQAYVPEKAHITDLCTIGNTLYVDYQLNNVRYLIAYYSDGSVQKNIRANGSDDVYAIDSRTRTLRHRNVAETRQRISITETEALRRMEEFQKNPKESSLSCSLENPNTRASKVVYPLSYTAVSSTAPYKAKNVLTENIYLSSLSGTTYSTYQRCTIYETMAYHTEVVRETQPFVKGDTIGDIAAVFLVSSSTMERWLTVAGVVFNGIYDTLTEACQVVEENAYVYQGGKECGIYDPTTENKLVEVYSLWGQGRITMIWNYDSSTGYRDPTWGHSARSAALLETNSAIRSEGQRIYNAQIITYGSWQWGVGNGFGY